MSSRSWRMAAAIAFLFALSLAIAPAVGALPPEKGKRCSDGIDNDGDGLIDAADPDCGADDGGDGGDATTYSVEARLDAGVVSAAAVGGEIDETHSLLENESPNPAPDYYLGAQLAAPPVGGGLAELTIAFADAGTPEGTTSCGDFFLASGGVGPNTVVVNADGSGTWTGPGYVRVWLDETSPDGETWQGLGDGGTYGATARINGFVETTVTRGKKKTVTETTNLFSLRFDDQWEPDGDEGSALYATLGARADDLAVSGTDTDADPTTAETWTIVNGSGGNTGLIHSNSGGLDAALCDVQVVWTVIR